MKKALFFVLCGVGGLILLAQHGELLGRLQWLEAPRVHVVQKGESLSKLAQENYGDVNYWRELALINRAPRPNHIEPGEQVLLPAANVLQELRRARTLTHVNSIADQQSTQAAGPTTSATPAVTTSQPAPEAPTNAPATVVQPAPAVTAESGSGGEPADGATQPEENNSSNSWFWLILGLIALGGVIGFIFYRKRQEENEKLEADKAEVAGERRNFQHDRRSIISRKEESLTT